MQHINFKKILVPVDFSNTSHKALEHVKWLASKFFSEVTLIHIHEIQPITFIFPSLYIPQEDFSTEYRKLALEKLDGLRKELIAGGIENVHIKYFDGSVAPTIDEYATKEAMDIVVMGTHGSTGLTEFFIGSNAFKVVNLINQPVLSINSKGNFAPYKTIVTPLDDSKYSRAKFPYIAELAGILGAEVKILYPELSDTSLKNTVANHLQQVTDLLTKREVANSTHIVTGNLAHELIKFAEYSKADLIVMMSETEMTISKMLLGSQAQQVVNHSVVPVITLHPEDKGDLMNIFA
jgi:nucleotide-binding universal stress UspA family protein